MKPPRARVDEVLARIEDEVARSADGAIAFDGDGTLWAGDIGEDFFAAILSRKLLTEVAREALVREAQEAGLSDTGTAVDLAHRIHEAYLAGSFPEERVCEVIAWITAGWHKSEVDAFAEDVLDATGFRERPQAEALRVVEWARRRGVTTLLVSASPRPIVEAAARRLSFDLAYVAAVTEHFDTTGAVKPSVHRPIPYGDGKVARLRERLGGRPLHAAFGDNVFDVSMLRASRVPVMIRPKPALVERAPDVPGVVILEPL